MKYLDEFRDPVKARALLARIQKQLQQLPARTTGPLQIMEVCGGHTHAIFRYGLEELLPKGIELVHGPGCPVCVLPTGRVDAAVDLAQRPQVIFATFGDAMRVPGSRLSLQQAKAQGADVRMVYSPMDALQLARDNPEREVVFFALGFETTMPATALTLLQAEREKLKNFSLLCHHITIIPTLKALLDTPGLQLDGFIGPGHVSTIIGCTPYRFISENYGKPLVISGFEPLDILQSLSMLLQQFLDGRCTVENQYQRVVNEAGNRPAQQAVATVFSPRRHCEWRGLGAIDSSGVRLSARFATFDAERRFALQEHSVFDPPDCRCGEVLTGALRPRQCSLFGTRCTPETPIGALMVSSEGACAAVYQYSNKPDALA